MQSSAGSLTLTSAKLHYMSDTLNLCVPLTAISHADFHQPVFGANNIAGDARIYAAGLFAVSAEITYFVLDAKYDTCGKSRPLAWLHPFFQVLVSWASG
jgi:hypothetical protein